MSTPLKLHQINALVVGHKTRAERALTDAHHAFQKAPPLSGVSRIYRPKDDEGEQLPPESTKVQISVAAVTTDVTGFLGRLFNLQLSQDTGNAEATADIRVDGQVILAKAPVTYLLWVGKRLEDLRTFIDNLPALDAAETWSYDEARECWTSNPVQTVRSKKVPRNHVLSEATDKHAAQVQVFMEDVPVGTWTTEKLSGALPPAVIREYRRRVMALIDAVKVAREEANAREVADRTDGSALLDYLFG